MEQHVYRERAEVFHADLNRAYYRHLAGHDPGLPLQEIYDRHGGLFTRQAVLERQEALERAAAGSDAARSARMLWDFALEGHLGQLTTALEEELARREVAIELRLPGEREPIGFRESPVLQANEPDGERRAAIEAARHAAIAEQLGDLHRQVIECQHATAAELGFASYRALCEAAKGIDLDALHGQTRAFTAATDGRLAEVLDPELRRILGDGHAALRRADIPRVRRAPADDRAFPADRLVASFTATLTGLGIDAHGQPGVHLDLESRPGKTPRAFCAPVRVPEEIYLVLTPIGGREDYAILFHEAGHTEQFAHIAAALPFEFRCLGDAAATETFAFLLQHLTDEPAWQRRHLGVDDPQALAGFARVSRFLYLRQYAAKLAYELELHGGERPAGQMGGRYAELLGAGLGVPWSEETFLSDVDPGFYSAGYLRAWALEAHLRAHLRERFGETWWEVAEAGELLRELWRDGMRLGAEEMLAGLTGETLDFRILLADLDLAA